MALARTFAVLCGETDFTIVVRAYFATKLSRLIYTCNETIAYTSSKKEGCEHAPSHSMQYPAATSVSICSSSQPSAGISGLIPGCAKCSSLLSRIFASENVPFVVSASVMVSESVDMLRNNFEKGASRF